MEKKVCDSYCYRNMRDENKIKLEKMDRLDLVVFDMDGVLTDVVSSWKYIHDYFHTSNERSVDLYVRGKIDDKEFIRRDAALWKINGKPLTKKKLEEILLEIPLMTGAKETISFLKENNVKTAIVSAGLDILADRIAKDLGIDYIYANGIETDKDGYLNGDGIVGVRLRFKDDAVKKIAKENNFPLNRIASVGNSCFDIPMFEVSGLGIAFNPEDDCVCDYADHVIKEKDLRRILPIIETYL